MLKIKNPIENTAGNIECKILINGQWKDFVCSPDAEFEIHESSEWTDVKPLPQAEKDEYQAQQDRESVIIQITSLESKQTPRKLREAALGDVEAIKFLQDLENEIAELRKQL